MVSTGEPKLTIKLNTINKVVKSTSTVQLFGQVPSPGTLFKARKAALKVILQQFR